jgi:hypothetical protein
LKQKFYRRYTGYPIPNLLSTSLSASAFEVELISVWVCTAKSASEFEKNSRFLVAETNSHETDGVQIDGIS